MAYPLVTNTVLDASGSPVEHAEVTIELLSADKVTGGFVSRTPQWLTPGRQTPLWPCGPLWPFAHERSARSA